MRERLTRSAQAPAASRWPINLRLAVSRSDEVMVRLDRFHQGLIAQINQQLTFLSSDGVITYCERPDEMLYLLAVAELIFEVVQLLFRNAEYPHLSLLMSRLHFAAENTSLRDSLSTPLPYL